MAIVKMNKFTLLTFESKKEELLRRLQGFSNVEFINLQDENILEANEELQSLSKDSIDSNIAKYEEDLSKAKMTLDFLTSYMPKKSGLKALEDDKENLTIDELEKAVKSINWNEIYAKVKEKEDELHSIESKITKLEGEIEVLTPWQALDISFEALNELDKVSTFVGSISKQYEEQLTESLDTEYVEIISRGNNDINVVVVALKERHDEVLNLLRGFGFSSFKSEYNEIPQVVITNHAHEIEELKSKIFFVKEEVASFEEDYKKMKLVYDYLTNAVLRYKASNNFLRTTNTVAIQGWCEVEKNEELQKICKKVLGATLIAVLLASFNMSLAVSQTDINNQKSQQQENNNKIKETEQKKEEVKEIKDETLKEVEQLNSQITDYQGQITSLDAQISDANTKIKEQETKLAQAQKDYQEQQDTLEKRIVAVYESGETSYLDVLLSSEGLTDFISNYYLVSEVTQYDTEMLQEIQKQKEEIENAKKEIENSKNELTTAKASKESVAVQLKDAKAQKDAKVSALSAEEQQLQQQIAELQKDNEAIDKEIRSMQAQIEAARKAAEEAKKNNNKSNSNSGSNSGTSSAGFIRPVNSYITTGMYYSSGSYHGAVDFGAGGVSGMPIYAVADGVVMKTAALTTSYGNYIIIYHPSSNLFTLYAHGQAGSISVSQGQTVKQGQQIMRVGSTGNSTGPHLHFEVRTYPGYYSNRVNPANYLP